MEFDLRDIPTKKTIQELADKIPQVDITAVETLLLFLRTTTNVYKALEENLARFGLSAGKYSVLMLLYRTHGNGLSPSELAEKAGITRATVTGLLDGLEREGLAERQSHPADRRMIVIKLTKEGITKLENMLPDHSIRISRLMSKFSPHDREQLLELLEKFNAGLPLMRDDISL